jgi:nicotinate-nucleotide adenylyltransferase
MPEPAAPQRIALFGGTFDPVHRGHLHLAEEAKEQARLDRVIFLPCRQSPHKPDAKSASGEDRLEMLGLATAELPWAEVDRFELDRPEPSFSYQTAEHFAATYPHADLYWLLGADQWEVIDTWTHPERIANASTFLVFPRDGYGMPPHRTLRARFLTGRFDAAATNIRERIRDDRRNWESYIPPSITSYIRDQKLYVSR